jgi:hypothetical protein
VDSVGVVPIIPDTKDWTWVLERTCPDCGFEAGGVAATDVAQHVLDNAAAWPAVLARPGVAARPSDDRWSDLEYACHVRDVFRLAELRIGRMLTEDGPVFANWDQDETAVEDRYAEQDPAVVGPELREAAERLAALLQGVDTAGWERGGTRSDGASFTVATFARYVIHDPVHHLYDVGVT